MSAGENIEDLVDELIEEEGGEGHRMCRITGCFKPVDEAGFHIDGTYHDYPIEEGGEQGEFPVDAPVDDSLWETRIILTAKQDVKISPTQTMTETKTYDVTDFLTQVQLDHILDCIQPINEI